MNINWKARLRNKWFWVTIIPALLLLVQQVAGLFGVTLDLADLQSRAIAIVGTVFAILAVLGVAVDMTTEGIGDSARALGYDSPYSGKAVSDEESAASAEQEEASDAAARRAREGDHE